MYGNSKTCPMAISCTLLLSCCIKAYICCHKVLYFFSAVWFPAFTGQGLIRNRVQITGCRATVSNYKKLMPFTRSIVPTHRDEKDGSNVTSQDTCPTV